ncbi:hypothetical protein [Microvirga alba]|uniref:Uncharacterized protein n=1 Tax=Microvirga alba TaxID=2791025 RepID=A0A931BPW3_9HYPH|nr:hypothetical protein [Microvirga alba]MBF9232574.1 hypothetical protein [Microvirga alba]
MAELLAKIGGTWHPERTRPTQGSVGNRHREVARLILASVERSQAASEMSAGAGSATNGPVDGQALKDAEGNQLHVGATVTYRPPGDKRTLTCRVERMEQGRAYIVPDDREIGWVSTHTLVPLKKPRDKATQPRPVPSGLPNESLDAPPSAPADATALPAPDPQLPIPQLKVGDAPARVVHYFNSVGDWIAYSRYQGDRYLFDKRGNWIGSFPWDDTEIVDPSGQYLGVVMDGNRIYEKIKRDPKKKREAGFVVHPGSGGYAGYPGFAAHTLPPFGFRDIDLTKISTVKRFWLKSDGGADTPNKPSIFTVWMSKIGLGGVAGRIEGMIGLNKRP